MFMLRQCFQICSVKQIKLRTAAPMENASDAAPDGKCLGCSHLQPELSLHFFHGSLSNFTKKQIHSYSSSQSFIHQVKAGFTGFVMIRASYEATVLLHRCRKTI